VHRDIKPENILCTGDQAIVADFGIARAVEVAGGERLTGTGLAVGTPAYMSPEQAMGQADVDARSDVYALGCVVYEMVTGLAPFEGETPQAMLAKHAAGRAPSLRTSDPNIPLFLERAVDRALAKRPDERFQTASAFAEALTSEMVVARVGRRRWPRRTVAGVVIAVVFVAAWWLSTVLGGPAYERLAVLPPTNVMNDSEQEHIIQGMLNGLISELGQAGITIIGSVQSMMRYQDTEKTVREIAGELGVDAVIESTVLWVGDSVAVDVRLTDGRTEESLWSQSYDEDARNVLALFRQVTGAVAAEIQLALTPQAEARLTSAREVDPQAYEAYLRGQNHAYKFTPPDLETALQYYQMALAIDNDYALAYAGIALVWRIRWQLGYVPPGDAAPRHRAALTRALELDSTLVEVQYLLALGSTWADWDWDAAEAAYRRAIELNPNFPEVRSAYALFLSIMKRPNEALEQSERAMELDPFRDLIQHWHGMVLYMVRRYEDAMAQFQRVLRITPNHAGALIGLSNVYHAKGMYDGEVATVQSIYTVTGFTEAEQALSLGYAEGDYQAAARRLGDTLAALRNVRYVDPVEVAWWYLRAGQNSQALDWLERGFEERSSQMPWLSVDPAYDPLREDPRFKALLRRMNLPH
jgi:TolB-like protein